MPAAEKPFGGYVLLGSLLRSRRTCAAIVLAGAGHLLITGAGLGGWPCPMRAVLGIPCPGCGLSRATLLFLQGHWQASFSLHPFAPALLLSLGLITAGLLMPDALRQRVAGVIAHIERKTRLTFLLLLGLILYWALRFALDGARFLQVGELFNNT